jgi:ion channel-forming bestrophin family protein
MPFRDILSPLASSKTLGQVLVFAGVVGLYSLLPMWKENSFLRDYGDVPSEIHAALSLVLGWLLVFRTNAAYNRWWEARTLWGALVNASRNLSIKLIEFARPSKDEREMLAKLIGSFPKQLRDHLRDIPQPPLEGTMTDKQLENPEEETKKFHAPLATVHALYRWLGPRVSERKLEGSEMRNIDNELAELLDICGACERIARTPFVRSYRIFLRQCIVLLLLTFPWGLANDFGWWTVPITFLVSYFMIGMEVVAEHVEEPFGYDEDDLDLDGLCNTISRSVDQIFRA